MRYNVRNLILCNLLHVVVQPFTVIVGTLTILISKRSERHLRYGERNPEVAVLRAALCFQKKNVSHKHVFVKRFHVVSPQICHGTALWNSAETAGELRLDKTTRELASTRMFSVVFLLRPLSSNVCLVQLQVLKFSLILSTCSQRQY